MDLKVWLWKNKITLTDLCHILDVSRGYMSEVINYHKKPSKKLAIMIEKETAGDVSAEYILSQEYRDCLKKSA